MKTKRGKDLKNLDGDKEFSDSQLFFKAMVWVFANISGLVTLTPEGIIHSCNQNFSLLLFGYQEKELVGKVSNIHIIQGCQNAAAVTGYITGYCTYVVSLAIIPQ